MVVRRNYDFALGSGGLMWACKALGAWANNTLLVIEMSRKHCIGIASTYRAFPRQTLPLNEVAREMNNHGFLDHVI